jgi:hypothetical protein
MIQKLVYSALIVMVSTAAFAATRDARDTSRDAKDDARIDGTAQAQSGAMSARVDANALGDLAARQVTGSTNQVAGETAQKVMLDPSLGKLPGVLQFEQNIALAESQGATPDQARQAALSKIRPELTDKDLIDACGK